jgi:hypothetical protein
MTLIRVDSIQKERRNAYYQDSCSRVLDIYETAPVRRRTMLCLVRIKGCKRCGGDLSIECDVYGVYAECIQCGANWFRKDLTLETIRENVRNAKTETAKIH